MQNIQAYSKRLIDYTPLVILVIHTAETELSFNADSKIYFELSRKDLPNHSPKIYLFLFRKTRNDKNIIPVKAILKKSIFS